jgi:hypothetical protein
MRPVYSLIKKNITNYKFQNNLILKNKLKIKIKIKKS